MISQVESFHAQINKGHQRKARGYSGQNIVSTHHNKNEDNRPKNYNQNNMLNIKASAELLLFWEVEDEDYWKELEILSLKKFSYWLCVRKMYENIYGEKNAIDIDTEKEMKEYWKELEILSLKKFSYWLCVRKMYENIYGEKNAIDIDTEKEMKEYLYEKYTEKKN